MLLSKWIYRLIYRFQAHIHRLIDTNNKIYWVLKYPLTHKSTKITYIATQNTCACQPVATQDTEHAVPRVNLAKTCC
jgi:hypothetical protein